MRQAFVSSRMVVLLARHVLTGWRAEPIRRSSTAPALTGSSSSGPALGPRPRECFLPLLSPFQAAHLECTARVEITASTPELPSEPASTSDAPDVPGAPDVLDVPNVPDAPDAPIALAHESRPVERAVASDDRSEVAAAAEAEGDLAPPPAEDTEPPPPEGSDKGQPPPPPEPQ